MFRTNMYQLAKSVLVVKLHKGARVRQGPSSDVTPLGLSVSALAAACVYLSMIPKRNEALKSVMRDVE
jgi:hypothetical protein